MEPSASTTCWGRLVTSAAVMAVGLASAAGEKSAAGGASQMETASTSPGPMTLLVRVAVGVLLSTSENKRNLSDCCNRRTALRSTSTRRMAEMRELELGFEIAARFGPEDASQPLFAHPLNTVAKADSSTQSRKFIGRRDATRAGKASSPASVRSAKTHFPF